MSSNSRKARLRGGGGGVSARMTSTRARLNPAAASNEVVGCWRAYSLACVADFDRDGLPDLVEAVYGSDPTKAYNEALAALRNNERATAKEHFLAAQELRSGDDLVRIYLSRLDDGTFDGVFSLDSK